jgi:AcrR family transcriptional regulator
MAAAPTRRKSAEERREEILAIAIEHFAVDGFRGTSTETIARHAGISQPYLFRLFRTKQELFLACDARACEKVLETFRRAASGAPPGEKLSAMGRAYTDELLPDRHAVLMRCRASPPPERTPTSAPTSGRRSATWRWKSPSWAGSRRATCGPSSPTACC